MRMDVTPEFHLPQRGEVGDAALVAAEPGGGRPMMNNPPTRRDLASLARVDLPALGEVRGSAAQGDTAA
jgi:hypothetical protein